MDQPQTPDGAAADPPVSSASWAPSPLSASSASAASSSLSSTSEDPSGRARGQRRAAIGAALVVGMAVGGTGTAAALSRAASSSGAARTTVPASAAAPHWPGLSSSSAGVVTVAALGAPDGAAATGMVLTAEGIVVTTHHAIDGASAIRVTDPSTGLTYDATLVAVDARADVAVLQVSSAAGLATANLDDDAVVSISVPIRAAGE